MGIKYKNKLVIFVSILALLVPTLTLLFPNSANAASYSDLSAADKARSYTYYRAMAVECMSGIKNEIKADANYDGLKTDPANGYWYGTGDSKNPDRKGDWYSGDAKNEGDVTPKNASSTGTLGCTEITKTALANYWGGVSPADFLKALKYKWNGTDKWVFEGDASKKSEYLKAFLTSQKVSMDYTPAVEYFVNYNAFINSNFCDAKDNGVYGGLSDSMKSRYGTYNTGYNAYEDTVYKKVTISGKAGAEEHGYTYTLGDYRRADSSYLLYTDNYKTCDDMAANITKTAAAYFDQVATDTCIKAKGYNGKALNACKDGLKNASSERAPIYCNKYSDPSEKEACEVGIGLVTSVPEIDAGKTDQTGDDETGTSCVVDGIGWMVCPLLNALGGLSDAMFAWLDSVLRLQPLSVNMSDPQNTQFSAWESIRNIANVVLVIAFIIIIFSQLTGMGVTNYGVKKTLPRLIIVALAINTSFYLMAIAVDVTNILGVGLHQIFLALLPDNSAGLDVANVIGSFVTGSAIVVGGATIAIASAGFSLSTLALMALPVIAVAMLALFAAVATLFVRNALIIILIVISPLAFAAYLLPNTQGLFTKWRKLFISMLMLFPMAAVLFGASKFASYIIVADKQPLSVLAAIFLMAAPLGMLPWLARSSGGIVGNIGGKLAGLASKARNPINKSMEGHIEKSRAASLAGQRNMFGFKQRAGKTNIAQRMNNRRMSREAETGNLKGAAEENYRDMALSGTGGGKNGKAAARAQAALHGQQEHTTRKGMNDAKAQEMHTARINQAGSPMAAMDTATREAKLATARNEAQTQARFDQHVQGSASLTRTEQATRRAQEVSKTVKAEQDHAFEQLKSTDATLLGLQDRQADAQLKTEGLAAQQATRTAQRQQAVPGLLDVRLATEANKKETAALDQQVTEKVAAAGTTEGAADLIASGVSAATVQQIQNAHETQADSQLRTTAYTEQATTETQDRQQADTDLLNTRLKTEASKKERGVLDQQVTQMVAEAGTTEGGKNLVSAGVDQATVDSLRTSQVTSSIASSATTSAQNVQQQEYADTLMSSPTLTQLAGGIDPRGESRVKAGAKAVLTDASNKAIAAEKSTMTRMVTGNGLAPFPDPNSLWAIVRDQNASVERRAAAAGQIMKTGADQEIHNLLDYIGDASIDPNISVDDRAFIQQQISDDMGGRKPTSIGAGDAAALSTGTYSGTFNSKVVGRIQAGKISGEGLANTSSDELDRMITVLQNGGIPAGDPAALALRDQIDEYLMSDMTKKPPKEISDRMRSIESLIR